MGKALSFVILLPTSGTCASKWAEVSRLPSAKLRNSGMILSDVIGCPCSLCDFAFQVATRFAGEWLLSLRRGYTRSRSHTSHKASRV